MVIAAATNGESPEDLTEVDKKDDELVDALSELQLKGDLGVDSNASDVHVHAGGQSHTQEADCNESKPELTEPDEKSS